MPIPTDEGRHIRLTLVFEPTFSNAVLVAFGRDLNGSETLEPGETEFVAGCDCGEPFVRDEVRGAGDQPEQELDRQRSSSPSAFTFDIRQSRIASERWDIAKVTTHNLADTNLTVTAEFYTKGTALILW